jgi:Na+/proline symporter
MNSVASALTTDFYQRFRPGKTQGQYLYFARWITAIVGIAGTLLALMMASWNIKSLWDQLNTFIGLFAGGLGGLFLLGLFTKRANGTGAVIGLVASAFVQYYVKAYTDIFLLLYTFSGLVSCFVIGYVASLFFPKKE